MNTTEWKRIRSHILRRDAYRCRVIECRVKGASNLTVHHIVPRDEGGGDYDENLITLCPRHHDEIEVAGVRIIALIESWEPGTSTEAANTSSTFLDVVQETAVENTVMWTKVHLCHDTTVALVLKMKNESGMTWADLAKHLGYPVSFAATLSAVANDKPGAISAEGEDELRSRVALTPINPVTVKRSEAVKELSTELVPKTRKPSIRTRSKAIGVHINERIDTTIGVRLDDAGKFIALAEMCDMSRVNMFEELIRFFCDAHKIDWTTDGDEGDWWYPLLQRLAEKTGRTALDIHTKAVAVLEQEVAKRNP